MIVPLSWLEDFVTITLPVEKLAERLTFAGTKVEEITRGRTDAIFTFEITANRPDTLSVFGIAREIAVLTGAKLHPPKLPMVKTVRRAPFSLTITDKTLCPTFAAILLEDVCVQPSPAYIQDRLKKTHFQSINNVVDITNYVMLELGIPMHAFDADRIHGRMTMRPSMQGEKITTLDGKTVTLPKDAIVIEDEKGLIDLAGLMGGKSSGITATTKSVFLLTPIYDPIFIRRTSKHLGLRTEASTRFEKKLDPCGPPGALRRAIGLLQEHAGARENGMVVRGAGINRQPTISYPLNTSSQVLGIDIQGETATRILTDLGCTVTPRGKSLRVLPPSFRRDLLFPVDLAEELGRIIGYNTMPKTIPAGEFPTPPELFSADPKELIRDHLVRLGFSEHIGPTMLSKQTLAMTRFPNECAVPVINPMAKDYACLRPSLLVSLLNAVFGNQRFFQEIDLFEIGAVFTPTRSASMVNEYAHLALITTNPDVSRCRGVLDSLFQTLGVKIRNTKRVFRDDMEGGNTLYFDNHSHFGFIHPRVLAAWNIAGRALYAEIHLPRLLAQTQQQKTYKPIAPYPAAFEDISFFIDRSVPIGDIWAGLEKVKGKEVVEIELLDIFTGKSVPQGKKSVTIRLTIQSKTTTLNQKEINRLRSQMTRVLLETFNAVIRDKRTSFR